ncbi:MAG TPA: hypothetical protein VGU01_06095 [Sphingomicrobium sp.]|nr:hypothetical protein [Sphingomicrobium sp.]
MHIHLPKPLHGWRALVGEIGIIVVGVLIALSAEQLVESVHDRAQVRHGEQSLKDNFRRFVTYTAEIDAYAPCISARAAELRQLIDRSAVTHRLPSIGPIPQVEARPWQIDTYDAMVTSQAITHVAHEQAILYSRIAMSAIDIYDDAKVEWSDWGILASLSGASRSYGNAEEAQDRVVLASAVHQDALMRLIATNTLERIRHTGLLDDAIFDSATVEGRRMAAKMPMCRPIEMSSSPVI